MPWTAKDAKSHNRLATGRRAAVWARIANAALTRCRRQKGTDCEGRAIRIANAAIKNMH